MMNLYTVTNAGRVFARHIAAKSAADALHIVRNNAYNRLCADYDDPLVIARCMACYDYATVDLEGVPDHVTDNTRVDGER